MIQKLRKVLHGESRNSIENTRRYTIYETDRNYIFELSSFAERTKYRVKAGDLTFSFEGSDTVSVKKSIAEHNNIVFYKQTRPVFCIGPHEKSLSINLSEEQFEYLDQIDILGVDSESVSYSELDSDNFITEEDEFSITIDSLKCDIPYDIRLNFSEKYPTTRIENMDGGSSRTISLIEMVSHEITVSVPMSITGSIKLGRSKELSIPACENEDPISLFSPKTLVLEDLSDESIESKITSYPEEFTANVQILSTEHAPISVETNLNEDLVFDKSDFTELGTIVVDYPDIGTEANANLRYTDEFNGFSDSYLTNKYNEREKISQTTYKFTRVVPETSFSIHHEHGRSYSDRYYDNSVTTNITVQDGETKRITPELEREAITVTFKIKSNSSKEYLLNGSFLDSTKTITGDEPVSVQVDVSNEPHTYKLHDEDGTELVSDSFLTDNAEPETVINIQY